MVKILEERTVVKEERPWERIERFMREGKLKQVGRIPGIIHQTWKDNNIPRKWLASPAQWKKHHPDWLHVVWTDRDIFDFIDLRHPKFSSVFRSFSYGIQKADAIRYFILHDFGGLYSDLDLVPKRCMEEYFADGMPLYFLFSPNMNVFTNFLMASAKEEGVWREIWKRLIHPVMPSWAIGKHLEVMYSTGPAMVNDVVMNYPHPIGFLPRTVFAPIDVTGEYGMDVGGKAGVIMLPGQSWNSVDSTVLNFFYTHRYKFITLCVLLAMFAVYVISRKIVKKVSRMSSSSSNLDLTSVEKLQLKSPLLRKSIRGDK